MTKTKLEELYHMRKEKYNLDKRIERLEKQSSMASDVVQNGYKRHAVIYGVDVKRAYKLQSLYEKYRKFKIMIVEKEKELEDYIETIPFSEIRQIFRYRYIDNYNWIQIGHKMNELYKTDRYNEDNIRMKHDRFLKKD